MWFIFFDGKIFNALKKITGIISGGRWKIFTDTEPTKNISKRFTKITEHVKKHKIFDWK